MTFKLFTAEMPPVATFQANVFCVNIDAVIAANAKNVAEFRAGNEKALNGLLGQIMKASKGSANPQQAGALLRAKLA